MVKKEVKEFYLELVYESFSNGASWGRNKPSFIFKDINSKKSYSMYPLDLNVLLQNTSIIDGRVSGVFKKCYRGGSETIQYVREEL